jgi:hypothetical protein
MCALGLARSAAMLPTTHLLFHVHEAADHESLMILWPVLVALLCAVIVAITWLGQRGYIGPLDRPVAPAGALRPVAAGLSVGAGLIHLAVIPEHLDEGVAVAAFFGAAAAFQLGWAAIHLARPERDIEGLGRAANAIVIGVWVWSRFVGLPIGPEPGLPEAIGFPDLLATLFEAALVGILMTRLAARPKRPKRPSPEGPAALRFADVAIARTFGILAIAILTGAAIAEVGGLA